jgi:DUF1680 family protein
MKINRLFSLFCGLLISVGAFSQSLYPGLTARKIAVSEVVPLKAYSFNLSDVKLLDSRFTENMERESAWILSIGANRLLHSFRINSGVYSGLEGGYDTVKKMAGWESLDCELRGHTMGHILSGLAFLYASTGKEVYRMKSDSLIKGLDEVQKTLNQGGYLSAYPQTFIDRVIAGKPVWAPWYTLHKVYAGLLDTYLYTGNQTALELAKNAGSWAYGKVSVLSSEQLDVMLKNEFGGVNETFYNLYSVTGNHEYLKLAEMFYHKRILDPLSRQEDNLKGLHANTLIPKITGEARAYELTGEEKFKTIATFFWQKVIDDHTYATGGNSDREGFFEPGTISNHLSGYTSESCNTYNMLKLTRHLFTWYADVKYADYYEQALYNHILGQQDPKTGMISYFLPSLPGSHKMYSTPDSSYWCCVGTGFENHAKYGEAIYYHDDKGIFVNLFIPSELTWKEKGVKVIQETKFPYEETTTLTINTEQTLSMPLYIRYPSWAISGADLKVNGKTIKVNQSAGSYITVDRKWKNGDKLTVTFPMKLRVIPMKDNPEIFALAYGPLVLSGLMGTEQFIKYAPYSNPWLHNDYYRYDYNVPGNIIKSIAIDQKNPEASVKPVEEQKLTWKTEKEGVILKPLFDIHRERYVTYWNVVK